MDRRMLDRRVGPRVPIGELEVAWRIPPPDSRPRGLRRPKPQTGTLLDLSVSGASVVAPAANDLSVGCVLLMGIDDNVGKVKIRRIVRRPDRRGVLYGVEFNDVASPLTRYVHQALTGRSGPTGSGRREDDLPSQSADAVPTETV